MKPILLIEDDPREAESESRTLARAGVRNPVVVAADAAQAFAILHGGNGPDRKPPSPPALVLLGLALGGGSEGFDILTRIRSDERTRDLPVIVTGSTIEADLIRGYREGADVYLRRPLTVAKIVEALRSLRAPGLDTDEPRS